MKGSDKLFSKDPKKKLKQIESALKYNKNLSNEGREKLLKMKADLKTDKSKPSKKVEKKVNQYGVEVGDIFYDSYGYDATYYTFYEVTDILGKSKVKVRELAKEPGKTEGYGPCDWTIRPAKGKYRTEPVEKIVKKASYMKDDGTKNNLVIGGVFRDSHAFYVDRDKAFNEDWHEDNYH